MHMLGVAAAAASALYEGTFRDACVLELTPEQTTQELLVRLQVISAG
jgi:hypothetical protein